MAASTMDLGIVEDKANSIYEAVLIIAKRARAITAERKAREVLDESLTSSDLDFEDFGSEENEVNEFDEAKAIVVAMEDFFNDKLEVNYRMEDSK